MEPTLYLVLELSQLIPVLVIIPNRVQHAYVSNVALAYMLAFSIFFCLKMCNAMHHMHDPSILRMLCSATCMWHMAQLASTYAGETKCAASETFFTMQHWEDLLSIVGNGHAGSLP